jgi:hypothetical protein
MKFKFSIDKSALAAYTNMNSQELITKAVVDANTLEHISIMTGVKYKTEMKYMDTDAVFQAGGCGFNASGTTTLTKKDMEVTSYKVNESLCPEDLNTTGLQLSMAPGFNQEVPFEEAYAEYKAAKISEAIESYIWNGDGGSPETFTGFVDKFDADSDVVDVTFDPSGAHTAAEYVQLIFDMVNAIPAAIKGRKVVMFMGYDYLAITAQKFIQANYYAAQAVSLADGRNNLLIPGTNVEIIGVNGFEWN